MKKTAEALIKSVNKFESKLKIEAEKVSEAIEVIDTALDALKEAGRAHKDLKKKLDQLQKKTEKLVQYKGFDITRNYEQHDEYKAMKFIDDMKTSLFIFKGLSKREEQTEIKTVSKQYLDSLLKEHKDDFIKEESDIIIKNEADESIVITFGQASEQEYYISGITYHAKPKAKVPFTTLYKFLDYFSDSPDKSSTILKTFLSRK